MSKLYKALLIIGLIATIIFLSSGASWQTILLVITMTICFGVPLNEIIKIVKEHFDDIDRID